MDIVERLIAQPPVLHADRANQPVDYGVSDELLRFLGERVHSGMRTLETGAGHSTLVFAARGAEHDCIVPEPALVDRIREFGASHGIACDRVRFHTERSELVLPRIDSTGYELALIDGRHAFPSPFLDWYYLAPRLRVGGLVVVDDTQLWTGRVLRDFLLAEPEWRVELDLAPRTTIFEKTAEGSHDRNWGEQPYVARMSRRIQRRRRLEKWWDRLTPWRR